MKQIDTQKILNKTNQLIGYENYEREEKLMKHKLRNITFVIITLTILIGGATTADAMTDNSITNSIKNLLNIKVNGEEKNAKCEKGKDGNLKCSLDKEVLGNDDTEITVELAEDIANDVSVSLDDNGENQSAELEIKTK